MRRPGMMKRPLCSEAPLVVGLALLFHLAGNWSPIWPLCFHEDWPENTHEEWQC